MTDELIKTIILGAPNLAVALFTLYWAFRAIERKDAALERRTDELLTALIQIKELKTQLNGGIKKP